MNDFLRQNETQFFLDERLLIIEVPFEVVGWPEIMSGEDTYDGWTRFRARWPKAGGYYYVSAVGFDASRSRALVYVGRQESPVTGEGQYHFMEKINGWMERTPTGVNVCRGLPSFY